MPGWYEDSAGYEPPDPAEQFWDAQKNYPRGHGPRWEGEDAPSDSHADHLWVDDEEPPHHLDPGFQEDEVDTHPDPDHGREDHRIGAILRQAEQWPERVAGEMLDQVGEGSHVDWNGLHSEIDKMNGRGPGDYTRDYRERRYPGYDDPGHYDDYGPEENDWEHQREHEAAAEPQHHWNENALGEGERFLNRDPEFGGGAPRFVGGDPEGAVSIEPPDQAGPNDARVLRHKDTGLGYDVIARPSPTGKGWDILKPL